MHRDCKKIIYTEEEIQKRCVELGAEITRDYANETKKLMIVGLLKGSVPFMSDLIKRIDLDVEIDFMDVSSYSGTNSTEVKIIKDIESSVLDKNVLIVEDIIDTGKTLAKVVELFQSKGANSVKIATLLDKPEGRQLEVPIDYVGFVVPNEFIIGYGLDYNQKYRNLPYIGVIKESAI